MQFVSFYIICFCFYSNFYYGFNVVNSNIIFDYFRILLVLKIFVLVFCNNFCFVFRFFLQETLFNQIFNTAPIKILSLVTMYTAAQKHFHRLSEKSNPDELYRVIKKIWSQKPTPSKGGFFVGSFTPHHKGGFLNTAVLFGDELIAIARSFVDRKNGFFKMILSKSIFFGGIQRSIIFRLAYTVSQKSAPRGIDL